MWFLVFLLGLTLVTPLTLTADVEYSTLIGGSGGESPGSVWGDDSGRALVAGTTSSQNLATTAGAFKRHCGGAIGCGASRRGDVFVGRLSADGAGYEFLTYLGGDDNETVQAVRGDRLGTAGVVQPLFAGGSDVSLTKYTLQPVTLRALPASLTFYNSQARSSDLDLHISAAAPARAGVPVTIRAEDSWVSVPFFGSQNQLALPESLGRRLRLKITATPPSNEPGTYESAVLLDVPGSPTVRIPVRFVLGITGLITQPALSAEYVIGDPVPIGPAANFFLDEISGAEFQADQPWVTIVRGRHFRRSTSKSIQRASRRERIGRW